VNVAERRSAYLTAALKDLARRAFDWAALFQPANCPWAKECLLVNIGCQVSCNRAEKTTQFIERRSKGRSKALADHFAVCVRIWTSVPNRVLFSVQPEQSFLLICVSENNRSGTLISKPGKYLRRNYQIYNRQST
jgi:hypothetical protein